MMCTKSGKATYYNFKKWDQTIEIHVEYKYLCCVMANFKKAYTIQLTKNTRFGAQYL